MLTHLHRSAALSLAILTSSVFSLDGQVAKGSNPSTSQPASTQPSLEFNAQGKDMAVEKALAERNLPELQRLGDAISARLMSSYADEEVAILTRMINSIQMWGFEDVARNEFMARNALRDRFAMVILRAVQKHSRTLDAKQYIALVSHLSLHAFKSTQPSLPDRELIAYRDEEFDQWKNALLQLQRSIDAIPDVRPVAFVRVPANNYPAGIDPKHVQDPIVRAEYEKRIAENEIIRKKSIEKSELSRMRATCTYAFKRFAVYAYSCPPLDYEGLKKHLAEINDPALTKAVLDHWAQTVGQPPAN